MQMPRRFSPSVNVLRWIAICSLCAPHFAAAQEQETESYSGTVAQVIDGDTLRLTGYQPRIRLFGIDAPERGEQGYDTATHVLRRLTSDQRVRCETINIDRYGRTVAKCWNEAGRELSAEMIRLNAATEWCRYSGGIYGSC